MQAAKDTPAASLSRLLEGFDPSEVSVASDWQEILDGGYSEVFRAKLLGAALGAGLALGNASPAGLGRGAGASAGAGARVRRTKEGPGAGTPHDQRAHARDARDGSVTAEVKMDMLTRSHSVEARVR